MKNSEDLQIEIQNRSAVLHQRQLSPASNCIQTMSEWWGVLRIVQDMLQTVQEMCKPANIKSPLPINYLRN